MSEMRINKPYWKGRNVLVTGHEGFLGSWLTRTLLDCHARVVGIDKIMNRPVSVLKGYRDKLTAVKGDVSNLKLIKDVIGRYKPRTIFHLAAEAIVENANKNPVKAFKSNIEGTWNILEASRGVNSIEAVVAASSDKAYGSHCRLPYKETASLNGAHPYDVSKSCADLLCYSYYNTYKVPVAVTRCGNIYGPGDFNFSRIVPDAIRSVLNKRQLVIRSDGKFTRDYIYVEDIVWAYLGLAQKLNKFKLAGEAFNFSDERPISVLRLFEIISRLEGVKKINPRILNQAKFEIKHQYLCAKKAREILGWQAKVNLEEGLRKTIEWYRKVYPK